MKKKINKLEIKRLFKEFGYLKADEEYKADFIQTISPEFEVAIKNFLKNRPDLNTLFGFPGQPPERTEHVNTKTEDSTTKQIGEAFKLITDYIFEESGDYGVMIYTGSTHLDSIKNKPHIKSDKLKKLYRQIATKTHPDKVKLKFLNDLYLKAKSHYQKDDLFSIYLICNDLDVEYKLDDDEIIEFDKKIKALRETNQHVERTYLWTWYFEEDENKKMQILNHFIIHNPSHVTPLFGPR